MPVSKKPRKAHRHRVIRSNIVTKEDVASLSGLADEVELIARVSLPAGRLTVRHTEAMTHLLNQVSCTCFRRSDGEEIMVVLTDGVRALDKMLRRWADRHDENAPIVATGDEITILADALQLAGTIARDELEVEPVKFIKDYYCGRFFQFAKRQIRQTDVLAVYEILAHTPSSQWDALIAEKNRRDLKKLWGKE